MNPSAKKLLKIALLSIFFVFISIYAFYRSKEIILGIRIKEVNIVDGSKIAEDSLTVSGIAKNAIKLTLNGREIPIDQAGNFREQIALLSGYNVIKIKAEDKFGYTDEKDYQLIKE